MIWVIQQWLDGAWCNYYHGNEVRCYSRKSEAQIALRILPHGRYRIISVRD
jgi:hypothetical protein